jgi:hypothetical protein
MEWLSAEAPEQLQAQAAGEGTKPGSVQVIQPLTAEESQRFTQLEQVIDAKLGDFFEVGSALMEIRGRELYRETHRTFNRHCHARWGFGRSYADRLISSAERVRLLPADVPKPANEFQIRPFLKLEPDKFPAKWEEIVQRAQPGRVTAKAVKEALGFTRKQKGRKPEQGRLTVSDYKRRFRRQIQCLRLALWQKDIGAALKRVAEMEEVLREL